ncbi:MAG TPA: type II toxin-antitoxin system RelE/ParE family toxin [Candidatus Paceibacterota bacterium]
MPVWYVEISWEAEKDLANLGGFDRTRIIQKLEWLGKNFDSVTPIALGADFKGFYKFRIGDYRAIYKIDLDPWGVDVIEFENGFNFAFFLNLVYSTTHASAFLFYEQRLPIRKSPQFRHHCPY